LKNAAKGFVCSFEQFYEAINLAFAQRLEEAAWQFLDDDDKWYTGMETNNHRGNTVAAGYQVRPLYALKGDSK
jgi:hypothetical protein